MRLKSILVHLESINKRLMINTDSMDSAGIKVNKPSDGNSANEIMLKHRKNPPITMSTSANSHKYELLFSRGLP